MKEQNQAYLVISIAFCGAAAGALSLVLQKNAHKNTEQSGQSAYKNTLWIAGLVLLFLSQVIYIGVLPFGDLILFSTTGAITLVCNAVFSAYMLGEVFTKIDLLATSLILAGTVGIVLQTHKEQKDFSKGFILELMQQTTQSLTLVTFYVYILTVYLFDQYVEKRIDKFYREAYKSSPIISDESFTAPSLYSRDQDSQIKKYQPSYSYLIGFIQSHPQKVLSEVSPSFGNLQLFVKLPMLFMALGCGMIAATNGLYFKLAGELIKSNGDDYNTFTDWLMYVFVVLGVAGAVIQLAFLQKLMSKYNQMESMPIFYGSMILFEIFAGLYLLDECIHYTRIEIFGLYLAAIITILGIQVIMRKPVQTSAMDNNNISVRNQSHDQSFFDKVEFLNKTDDFQRYDETEQTNQFLPPQSPSGQSVRLFNQRQIFENLIDNSDSETSSQADNELGISSQTRQVYERLDDMRRLQKENMILHS